MSKVAIITVPGGEPLDLCEIREFVKESLMMGILVKGQGVGFEIADIPDLGGVIVCETLKESCDPPCAASDADRAEICFSGYGAKEKRRIYDKLMRYRADHGLGCLDALASVIGNDMTAVKLRDAMNGKKLTMDVWRQIGIALDRLDTEGDHGQAD